MSATISTERLMRFLNAPPETQAAVDRVLMPTEGGDNAPAFIRMFEAAKLLGVSRSTLWRMVKAGRLDRVEIRPGSFRLRRAQLTALAGELKGGAHE
jgi:excisionase family DNA binding protein